MIASKQKVAHFILETLLENTVEEFGSPHVFDDKGRLTVYSHNQTFYFEESQARLKYFVEKSDYSLKQITDAFRLLMANGHIETLGEYGGSGLEYISIKATPQGILAYEEKTYKTINYQKWTFWLAVVLNTAIALAAMLISLNKK